MEEQQAKAWAVHWLRLPGPSNSTKHCICMDHTLDSTSLPSLLLSLSSISAGWTKCPALFDNEWARRGVAGSSPSNERSIAGGIKPQVGKQVEEDWLLKRTCRGLGKGGNLYQPPPSIPPRWTKIPQTSPIFTPASPHPTPCSTSYKLHTVTASSRAFEIAPPPAACTPKRAVCWPALSWPSLLLYLGRQRQRQQRCVCHERVYPDLWDTLASSRLARQSGARATVALTRAHRGLDSSSWYSPRSRLKYPFGLIHPRWAMAPTQDVVEAPEGINPTVQKPRLSGRASWHISPSDAKTGLQQAYIKHTTQARRYKNEFWRKRSHCVKPKLSIACRRPNSWHGVRR